MSEKREDRWIKLFCKPCGGTRFNVLRDEEVADEKIGELECLQCGRVIRVTIAEIAPPAAEMAG